MAPSCCAAAWPPRAVVGRPREYFLAGDPAKLPDWRFWEEGPYAAGPDVSGRESYLCLAYRLGSTPNGVFGAKIHWNCLRWALAKFSEMHCFAGLDRAAILRTAFPGLRVVDVTRRDRIRQAVSWARMAQTGCGSTPSASRSLRGRPLRARRATTTSSSRVHVVQSSLSASIRALEHEVGAALFVRDSRHVMPTQAGRALLPSARRALAAADEGRDAVAGVRGVLRGQLHVGAIQTLGAIDLPALLAGFRRAHPGVTIRLSHDAASVLASAAADAQLDIAFIDGPTDPARLTRVEIGHDDMVLAVPHGDPLAERASIGLGDPALRERDFVDYRADSALRAQIDVACAAAGLARRTVCEAQNMQYLAELVQHGLGISVLPPMSVRSVTAQVSTIPITPPLRRDIGAVVATTRPPTGAAQALLDLLAADINSRRGQAAERSSGRTPPAGFERQR